MINKDKILESTSHMALWCPAELDSNDLAYAVSNVLEQGISDISVGTDSVSIVWPWLENKNVKIFSRFYFHGHTVESVSDITEKINTAFKQGCDGAQIFVSLPDLNDFVNNLHLIRDDLFFNKSLFIGLDINQIGPFDWNDVFAQLKKMRATGLSLALSKDDGDKSDFVGRVYAALTSLDTDEFSLQFILGKNEERIEQVYRLVKSMRPSVLEKLKFFVSA